MTATATATAPVQHPMTSDGTHDDGGQNGPRRSRLGAWSTRPPGLLFHLLLAVPAMALLLSVSVPGLDFWMAMFSGWALIGFAAVWLVRVVGFVILRRRGRSEGRPAWCLVAPTIGLVVVALAGAAVPLRIRWAMSRADFDAARASAPAPSPEGAIFTVPEQLGRYHVTQARSLPGGVVFTEQTGDLIDEAGFAYLPGGPSDELISSSFESPRFRALGGDWYAWTASW